MILTISGASGSGKTTLAELILATYLADSSMLESVTTREPRTRDLQDEFLYVSEEDFLQKEQSGEFLWTTKPIHGTRYGTLKESVDFALESTNHLYIMIIAPAYLQDLFSYRNANDGIKSLYIYSPGPETIANRLRERGENENEIAKRIQECLPWDRKTKRCFLDNHHVHFIHNNKPISHLAEIVLNLDLHNAP